MFRTRLLVLALVVLAASCGGSTRSMDGGAPPEAPRVDGGTPTYDAGGEGMVRTAEVWTEPADLKRCPSITREARHTQRGSVLATGETCETCVRDTQSRERAEVTACDDRSLRASSVVNP